MNINDSNIRPELTFRRLVYLHMQKLTNFPYIEQDFDALTDYELLCLVVKYLNDVIANSNEQNTSITNLYNAFLQLQTYMNNSVQELEDAWNDKTTELEDAWTNKTTELETAFNNLQTWINNYFDNLDVQDEINNKIDKMINDGTFIEIIENYMSYKHMTSFSNGLSQGGDVSGYQNEINIPSGTYTVTKDTNFFKTNFTTDSTSLIVIASDGTGTLRNISFIDCIFDKVGFQLYQKGHYIFKNCTFINTLNSAITNANSEQTIDVINCNFIDNAPDVDEWNTNASSVQSWKYTPINIYGNDLILNVKNCTFKNIMAGSCIYKPSTTTGLNFLIENSTFENLCGNGISLNTASYGKILNNKFLNVGGLKNTGSYKSTVTGVGMNAIYCLNPSSDISVIGNYIENVGENGIEGSINTIIDNIIKNTGYRYNEGYETPSTEGIYSTAKIIENNTIINSYTHGIVIPEINVSREYCNIINNTLIGTNNGEAIKLVLNANSQNTLFKINNNNALDFSSFIEVINNSNIYANVEIKNNSHNNIMFKNSFNKLNGFDYNNFNKLDVNFKNPNFINVTNSTLDDWSVSAGALTQTNNTTNVFGRLTAVNQYCNIHQTLSLNGDHNIICMHIKAKSSADFEIAIQSKDFANNVYTEDTYGNYIGIKQKFTHDANNFKDYYYTSIIRGNATMYLNLPTTDAIMDIEEISCGIYKN